MYKISFHKILIFLLLVLSFIEVNARDKRPLVWDYDELLSLKNDYLNNKKARTIINTAIVYSKKKPISVIDNKKLTFEPNVNYYCSIGPYWWPDSSNTNKYVNKDGHVNPESEMYDDKKLSEMSKRCQAFSKAFFITGEMEFYDAFIEQLYAWFIDKNTYMIPSFEYAQITPGYNMNKGRSTGMIDAYYFNTVIESIRLVNGKKRINKKTLRRIKKWFSDFAKDSESKYGESLYNTNNNVSLAFDVIMTNVYLFVGNNKKAKIIADNFAERRINKQILENGKQPAELNRTKAYTYSLYNLSHIIDFCYLVRYWYPNYYANHRDRIDNAFDFLGRYVDNSEEFPYKQITSWDKCRSDYYSLLQRRNELLNNQGDEKNLN